LPQLFRISFLVRTRSVSLLIMLTFYLSPGSNPTLLAQQFVFGSPYTCPYFLTSLHM
jgi:hypothetical protein